MASTSTDLVNMALAHIGANKITDIASATELGAIEASRFYTDTVKEVQRAHGWNCLKRRKQLEQFGRTPDFEWSYRFGLPSDFLRIERFNGVQTSEPQDLFEIETFQEELVENSDFTKRTYSSTASTNYTVDGWTDNSAGASEVAHADVFDYMKLTCDSGSLCQAEQAIHTYAEEEHTLTLIIVNNTGSGVVTYTIRDKDDTYDIASASTAAGFTGTKTLTFYADTSEVILQIETSTSGAVVDISSADVVCSTAPDQVLLTDVDSAKISYIANLTDVSLYEPKLLEVLALLLGSKLAIPMRQDESLKFSLYGLYEKELAKARRVDGNEEKRGSPVAVMVNDSEWVKSRRYSTNG